MGRDAEAAAFMAGSTLARLDAIALTTAPVATLWRRRLALTAAAAVCRIDGRREDLAELRDQWALARPGDALGPAARTLVAWRQLCEPRALRAADWATHLPKLFDLAPSDDLSNALHVAARLPDRAVTPVRMAAQVALPILALGPAHRGLALWLADATLARALGWARPVPLLATALPRAALRLEGGAWVMACTQAWTRAGIAAHDIFTDLEQRADRLCMGAAKLRGRDAKPLIAQLQCEDALPARAGAQASDRAARRLFDRLTAAGLVRELTGRPTFRLYGL